MAAASDENTNGLLRQYLSKGTDLSVHTAGDLARIAASLNGRPRKTLGFMTPSEKLAEFLTHTGLNPPCQRSVGVGHRDPAGLPDCRIAEIA
jgi:hypothetical protein